MLYKSIGSTHYRIIFVFVSLSTCSSLHYVWGSLMTSPSARTFLSNHVVTSGKETIIERLLVLED